MNCKIYDNFSNVACTFFKTLHSFCNLTLAIIIKFKIYTLRPTLDSKTWPTWRIQNDINHGDLAFTNGPSVF